MIFLIIIGINESSNDSVTNKNDLESNFKGLRRSKGCRTDIEIGFKMFTYLLEEDSKIFEEAMSLPAVNL